jgi:putative hydrolase of the HAD superfamily
VTLPPEIRGVLFDAVGTLIYADPPASVVYARAAQELGLTVDESNVQRRLIQALKNYHSAVYDAGLTTSEDHERNRWRAIVAAVFPELLCTEELFCLLWRHFSEPASWRVFSDVAACWERLTGQGRVLGIASNFDERLLTLARGLPPLDRSGHVFVSSRVGFRKPARQFFGAIEQELSLCPQQLLLVGDDWESDYLGATSAGWQAIYLDRGQSTASCSISSLTELV